MANVIYNSFKGAINSVSWGDNSTTTIKAMLVTSGYVPNIDTHSFISDVTNEVTGAGYTAGGKALLNRTITIDTTNDLAKYDADDIAWTASTVTARGLVIYKDTGTPATSPLIAYIDFVSDKTSVDADFVIAWHANGIFDVA